MCVVYVADFVVQFPYFKPSSKLGAVNADPVPHVSDSPHDSVP